MSWIQEFASGVGEAVANGIGNAFDAISDRIWSSLLSWIYGFIYNGIASVFEEMNGIGTELFELPWVQAMISFFSRFGLALYLVGCAVALFHIALDAENGTPPNYRRQILPLFCGFLTTGLFARVPVLLFRFCTDLQGTFSRNLASLTLGTEGDLYTLSGLAMGTLGEGFSAFRNLLILLCLGYGTLKCFLDNIKRGGILLLQISVGSLHQFGIPQGQTEPFLGWCRQIVAICFTTFMQTTFLYMGLITMQTHPILGAGIILCASEVPRIAQQFGLETGFRMNVMSCVNTTTRMLSAVRAIAK